MSEEVKNHALYPDVLAANAAVGCMCITYPCSCGSYGATPLGGSVPPLGKSSLDPSGSPTEPVNASDLFLPTADAARAELVKLDAGGFISQAEMRGEQTAVPRVGVDAGEVKSNDPGPTLIGVALALGLAVFLL